MARTPKDVTDAELAVLQLLWEQGASSVRSLVDQLYPGGGNSEAATVQKLLDRLLAKGCVDRNRRQRPTTFQASIDREGLIGRQLKSVADKLCAGSYTPLLSHLLQSSGLGKADIEALRRQVAQLELEQDQRRRK